MNSKEKKIQEALGTMFTCVGCLKIKVITHMSTGGVYMIDNFCLKCLKESWPFSQRMVLSERNYKAGYVIRQEFWDDRDYGGQGLFMSTAYTPSGDWIGDPKTAYYLCKKIGIAPEKKRCNIGICTIGYSELNKRYYGWSHRGMVGFAIGDKIFQSKFGKAKTEYTKHGIKTIRTKADQRKAAIAFSNYVS